MLLYLLASTSHHLVQASLPMQQYIQHMPSIDTCVICLLTSPYFILYTSWRLERMNPYLLARCGSPPAGIKPKLHEQRNASTQKTTTTKRILIPLLWLLPWMPLIRCCCPNPPLQTSAQHGVGMWKPLSENGGQSIFLSGNEFHGFPRRFKRIAPLANNMHKVNHLLLYSTIHYR